MLLCSKIHGIDLEASSTSVSIKKSDYDFKIFEIDNNIPNVSQFVQISELATEIRMVKNPDVWWSVGVMEKSNKKI